MCPVPQIAQISTYGGPFTDQLPQQDPQSEVSSNSFNLLLNDTSAMTATAPKACLQFLGSATTITLASTATWSSGYDSMWGNSSPVQPSFVRNSIGNITISFPSLVPTQLGTSVPLVIRFGEACSCSSGVFGFFSVNIVNANTIKLSMADHTGSLSDLAGSLITVMVF